MAEVRPIPFVRPKFRLGQVVCTAGIHALMTEDGGFAEFVFGSLGRHWLGDWGELDEEDRRENELSVEKGFRLLSAYSRNGQKIWIITEADRSATTVLFPDDY